MGDKIEYCLSCGSEKIGPWRTLPVQMHHQPENFHFNRCANCGLVQLNPRVSPEDLGSYYSEYYLPFRGPEAWGKYAPLVEMNLRKTDRKRAALVRRAYAKAFRTGADSSLSTPSQMPETLGSDSRVLDVGCGKPSFLELLQQQTGCYAKGIDFSDEGWRNEGDRFSSLDLEVSEFRKFEDKEPFDVITMWHYLEHDYHPRETLRRMKDVSHRESRLLIEVPNFSSWTRVLQGKFWEGYHTPRHTAVFSPNTLRTLLENSGWRVEKLQRFGTLDPYPLFWMGLQERRGIDWSSSMEKRFPGFMAGMILTAPLFLVKRLLPAGIMTVCARPAR